MTDPVPARVAVIDTDGDEFADRMYAADVRGRVWRLDIWNGHTRDTLVTGGVLADLSGEGRVFFNAPDVALIQPRGGEAYYNLALGSGEPRIGAAGPARDFFYSVRDKAPFTRRSQTAYDGAAPILAADLFDLTTSAEGARIAPEAAGWKIAVGTAGSVLGESLTVSGVVLFTTFQPSPGADACAVGGSSRVYALRVDTAVPGLDFDDDGEITAADLSKPLPITGLPGEIRIETGEPSAEWAGGGDASRGDGASGAGENTTANSSVARCLVGSYVLSSCVPLRTLVRTYWQRPSVN